MQNGAIKDEQITASTLYNGNYQAKYGKLGYDLRAGGHYYGWRPSRSNTEQWFQITFKEWTQIGGIAIQGQGNEGHWVKSFILLYSYDGVDFVAYKQSGKPEVKCTFFSCWNSFNVPDLEHYLFLWSFVSHEENK